jgi:hypothetical protein
MRRQRMARRFIRQLISSVTARSISPRPTGSPATCHAP